MSAKAIYSAPMLHAMDIERSPAFYERLGFVTADTDGGKPLGWARTHCEGGALVFLRGEHAVDPAVQGVMLYMYSPDLRALHAQLQSNGVAVPPISYPGYMPSGEIQLRETPMAIPSAWHSGDQTSRKAGSSA